MKRRIVTSLLILLTSSIPLLADPDPTALRAGIGSRPEEPVWVGQKAVFTLKLLITERPRGIPQFGVPDVPGGIVATIPGPPIYGSEKVDGIDFTSWSYLFVFFPHREGDHEIPVISVRVRLPRGDGTYRRVTAESGPFTITARLPEGAKGLRTLLTTTGLEAEETWDPSGGDVRVGDAVTRRITQRAPDVLGMGFPPLDLTGVEGVALYPKPPVVNDETYRGDIKGERTDTVVYLFEREGEVLLPGVVIPWFDLEEEKLKAVRFPPRRIRVKPNPALASSAGNPERAKPTDWTGILIPLAVVLAILTIGWIAVRRLRQPLRGWAAERRARHEASEPCLFGRLTSAVRDGDARAVVNCAARWLPSVCRPGETRTLTAFASRHGDEAFRGSVAEMMAGLYGRESGAWHDPGFLTGLEAARDRALLCRESPLMRLPRSLNPEVSRT